jgi:hypothetical protein
VAGEPVTAQDVLSTGLAALAILFAISLIGIGVTIAFAITADDQAYARLRESAGVFVVFMVASALGLAAALCADWWLLS